tara:strand:- start:201 stop:452 length:252 start_codon:yes stop_codon:yes gene_type:complete
MEYQQQRSASYSLNEKLSVIKKKQFCQSNGFLGNQRKSIDSVGLREEDERAKIIRMLDEKEQRLRAELGLVEFEEEERILKTR